MSFKSIITLLRLNKPVGAILLMLPCFWGLALADIREIHDYLLFAFGALAMRSFGCIVNDMADRSFDRRVERTKNRPLAKGDISIQLATLLAFVLLCCGGYVFLKLAHPSAQIISMSALIGTTLYPFAKRLTNWPQLFLGFVFNSGVWIGYAHGDPTFQKISTLVLFYGIGIIWTIAYDTIYAFQDVQEDQKIGIGSAAIQVQSHPKTFIVVLYTLLLTCLLPSTFQAAYIHASVFSWLVVFCVSLYWVFDWKPHDSKSSKWIFEQNQWLGWLVLLHIVVCYWN